MIGQSSVNGMASKDVVDDGRFEAAEREIAGPGPCQPSGKAMRLRVALPGKTVDYRAAGIAETEKLGYFVEHFTRSIIRPFQFKFPVEQNNIRVLFIIYGKFRFRKFKAGRH